MHKFSCSHMCYICLLYDVSIFIPFHVTDISNKTWKRPSQISDVVTNVRWMLLFGQNHPNSSTHWNKSQCLHNYELVFRLLQSIFKIRTQVYFYHVKDSEYLNNRYGDRFFVYHLEYIQRIKRTVRICCALWVSGTNRFYIKPPVASLWVNFNPSMDK